MPVLSPKLKQPHPLQQRIIRERKRFNVVVCGRRFGKTELAAFLLMIPALRGYATAFFSLSEKNFEPVWLYISQLCLISKIAVKVDASKHIIYLLGGGSITFWSLNNLRDVDKPLGRKYARVLFDEAAALSYLKESWTRVVLPMLTDFGGDGWFFSTPRGQNYFYELFKRYIEFKRFGKSEFSDWMSWQMPSAITNDHGEIVGSNNPFITPENLQALRYEMPGEIWRQELLAEFLDALGQLFKRFWFRDRIVEMSAVPRELQWYRYWDLAASIKTSADFTASAAIAFDDKANMFIRDVIHLKEAWPVQRMKIKENMVSESARFQIKFGIEKAIHGIAAVDDLILDTDLVGLNIEGIDPVGDKLQRALGWAAQAERRQVYLVNGSWINPFLDEICSFDGDTNGGSKDDRVDAVSGAYGMAKKKKILEFS